MARLSIHYDSELKEQVFLLRGDEDYARSTTTLLELGSPSTQLYGFNLSVTVNVLRDRGDGTIVIYDNDVIVGSIDDWTDQDNGRTITLTGLDYDIDHNIFAKYMGNKRCSPSSSKTETINVHDTYRTESELTLTYETQQYNPHESLTGTITLSNDHDTDYNRNQPITIIYDTTEISTIETVTDSEGEVSFEVEDVGEIGLHQLLIRYKGSDNLTSAEYSLDISVGYKVELTCTNPVIKYEGWDINATVTDYLGELVSPIEYIIAERTNDGTVLPNINLSQKSPLSPGVFNYHSDSYDSAPFDEVTAKFTISGTTYSSETVTVDYAVINSIRMTDPLIIHKNESKRIRVRVSPSIENVPVHIRADSPSYSIMYTNNDGDVFTEVVGKGYGFRQVHANSGNISKVVTLTDYVQYWVAGQTPVVQDYSMDYGKLFPLNNFYRLDKSGSPTLLYFGIPIDSSTDYEMYLKGVNSNFASRMSLLALSNGRQAAWSAFADGVTLSNATIHWVKEGDSITIEITNNGVTYTDTQPATPLLGIGFFTYDNLQVSFTELTLQEL